MHVTITNAHVARAWEALEMCPVGFALEEAFAPSNFSDFLRADHEEICIQHVDGTESVYRTPPEARAVMRTFDACEPDTLPPGGITFDLGAAVHEGPWT